MKEVAVQEADFDVGAELTDLSAEDIEAGAVASFVGLVRGGEKWRAPTLATPDRCPPRGGECPLGAVRRGHYSYDA